MKWLHMVTFTLLVIGGLNWLLVGVFSYDLVAALFGELTVVSKAVYILVGLSAIMEVLTHSNNCKMCRK